MRYLLVLSILVLGLRLQAQEDYIVDPLPNGRLSLTTMPDSVDVCVGVHTLGRRIRVPKTIFLPTAWNDVTGKPATFTPSSHTHTLSQITDASNKQDANSNLTTISGLTATSGNFLQSVSSAWASRTPAQVKVDLAIDQLNNTSDANKPISSATQTALNLKLQDNPLVAAYQLLGSPFKGETAGFPLMTCNTSSNLTDNQIRWIAVPLAQAQTLTGIRVYVRVLGSYTGDNNNRVGVYTYSGGTLTLQASSANSATLWTSAANALQTIAFSSTYAASAGVIYVAILYNNSAQTTAPALASGTALNNAAMAALAFTNSAKLFGTSNGNDLPSSIAMSAITASTVPTWVAPY